MTAPNAVAGRVTQSRHGEAAATTPRGVAVTAACGGDCHAVWATLVGGGGGLMRRGEHDEERRDGSKAGDPRLPAAAFISAHASQRAPDQTGASVALEVVDTGRLALNAHAGRGTPTRWVLSRASRRCRTPRPCARRRSTVRGTALRSPSSFEFQREQSNAGKRLRRRSGRACSGRVEIGPRRVGGRPERPFWMKSEKCQSVSTPVARGRKYKRDAAGPGRLKCGEFGGGDRARR